ncbi:Sec-independent protein translocase subunit TatA/TatB [Halopelagius longus]|uniref:Sec-independent protein translocase protein TatA n=1 Tax=Halopelagius longus TaxID=1236180 RepID=A0A1H1BW65_9EURY|nr:twin-arginine translocase TatA/TatE family subunit [Halopelagius longus]RDI70946.1 twin-arginine translocase TatA/TatE family subunit [Halopelagius longus]SDQ56000.1 sec-independent protein translocase protein TatA [Halopelagius longus]
MTYSLVPLFPGIPGGPEMLIVLLIVVLLFGANKLPKLARSTGQAMGEFKRGREDIETELREATATSDDAESDVETETETETDDTDRTTAA